MTDEFISLDVFLLKTWGKRLSQLLSLLRVSYNKCIQITAATDLKFGLVASLADLDHLSVTAASLLKEIPDVCDLLGHFVY